MSIQYFAHCVTQNIGATNETIRLYANYKLVPLWLHTVSQVDDLTNGEYLCNKGREHLPSHKCRPMPGPAAQQREYGIYNHLCPVVPSSLLPLWVKSVEWPKHQHKHGGGNISRITMTNQYQASNCLSMPSCLTFPQCTGKTRPTSWRTSYSLPN